MAEDLTVVVDLGVANYGSMMNMLKKIGANAILTDSVVKLLNARRIILPGVGAFDSVAAALMKNSALVDALNKAVIDQRIPFMGICVGMQILFSKSEEGKLPGLGWIKGEVKRFSFSDGVKLPVPHMGWSSVSQKNKSPLFSQGDKSKFYFVHSYHAADVPGEDIILTANYGYDFVAGVMKNNIFGFQFHPEKSHRYGIELFSKFNKTNTAQ